MKKRKQFDSTITSILIVSNVIKCRLHKFKIYLYLCENKSRKSLTIHENNYHHMLRIMTNK